MYSPNISSSTSVSSAIVTPWRAKSLRVINSNPKPYHKEAGVGRLEHRHHSADAIRSQTFYSAKVNSWQKDEQDDTTSVKQPQWAASRPQPEGGPGPGRMVRCRSTVTLNLQTCSSSHTSPTPQTLPSASCSSGNLSPDIVEALPLHTQKRSQQLSTCYTQNAITSTDGAKPCQSPNGIIMKTSASSPASPRMSPEGSHQGTTVLGTFNFQDRSRTPSLLARGEPPSSLNNCSLSTEEDGPTLLATFNFLGCPHPAPPMASRQVPAEGLSSLTDSFTSLEDGKHLLAVFDFTKPGIQRPPPPVALRPSPTNTQRPSVTSPKKPDQPRSQKCASAAPQKPTVASPKKSVQSSPQTTSLQKRTVASPKKSVQSSPQKTPLQKYTVASPKKSVQSSPQKSPLQKPTVASPKKSIQSSPQKAPLQKPPVVATSQISVAPHIPNSVPASHKKCYVSSEKHAPAAPQKSTSVPAGRYSDPSKQEPPPPNSDSQRSRSPIESDGPVSPTPDQSQLSTVAKQDQTPLSADLQIKRECNGRELDKENNSRTPCPTTEQEATLNTSKSRVQESSFEESSEGYHSKPGDGEKLSRVDDHFLSVELLCLDEKRKEEEEEGGHNIMAAPLSKQSSLDSISQFVSRQFADWDACSPTLSFIQSGEFWCTDRPLSPFSTVSTHPTKGEINESLFPALCIFTFQALSCSLS